MDRPCAEWNRREARPFFIERVRPFVTGRVKGRGPRFLVAWTAALVVACCGVRGGPPLAAAASTAPAARRLPLPNPRLAPSGRDWADLDAAPGDGASAQHPRGTVVVAQSVAWEPSPSVTEWDLATATLVRSAALPLPAVFVDLRIVCAGEGFQVVAAEGRGGRVASMHLARNLAIEHVATLGTGERPRLASDGATVAILWAGTRARGAEGAGWQLVVLDAQGERTGEARLRDSVESTFTLGEPLAVAGGHVFVLLPGLLARTPRVLELGADARPLRAHALPWTPDDGRLFAVGDRIFFTDDCSVAEVTGALVPTGLPDRRSGRRACPALDATADASGRLVTTTGDVLGPDLRLEHHFADPEGIVMRALWIDDWPALLVAGGAGGRASVIWSDESREPLLPGNEKR